MFVEVGGPAYIKKDYNTYFRFVFCLLFFSRLSMFYVETKTYTLSQVLSSIYHRTDTSVVVK